ncbi:hypothetical protein WJX74_002070 [Apatococcus lobatus]|uniref:SAGA-associated factor 11 n=1 Tax=Apatococcus lobatus TaxID=904363 RepID=A0AAW1QMS2_9CHLO
MAAPSRQTDSSYAQALGEKRLEVLKQIHEQLENPVSLVTQTVAAYQAILDDLLLDVAQEVHREVKTGEDGLEDVGEDPSAVPTPPLPDLIQARIVKGGVIDVFGQLIPPVPDDRVQCPVCESSVAAGRFAHHLEKCMGVGRSNRRMTSRRANGHATTSKGWLMAMQKPAMCTEGAMACHVHTVTSWRNHRTRRCFRARLGPFISMPPDINMPLLANTC